MYTKQIRTTIVFHWKCAKRTNGNTRLKMSLHLLEPELVGVYNHEPFVLRQWSRFRQPNPRF